LRFRPEQLICALGFNPLFQQLSETAALLNYVPAELVKLRNEIFTQDVYKKLTLDNVLTIYSVVKDSPRNIEVMQYLLENRLAKIESKIENTVNSTLIEKYKAEMRAIYMDGIAGIDFAEDRLSRTDSGFRALINEVVIITESRLIPAGNIFFRNNVLPEEKRKLLNKGLIPLELVEARLDDKQISPREKKLLTDYLIAHKQNNTGTS
ncbi:MAG: hypothetical protein ACRESK_09010, partial [Gammaproteobacteria bacterium]